MPLLDHFHPPLSKQRHWDSFHGAWAEAIARHLNEDLLPERYYAEARVKIGTNVEIDVATHEELNGQNGHAKNESNGGVAVWAPPAPVATAVLDFADLDVFEVQIFNDEEGPKLVSAIELISPANKDRPAHRRTFAIKCASYLQDGVSVMIVDVVTERHASLHVELLTLLKLGIDSRFNDLYACAYRPLLASQPSRMEVWGEALSVSAALPTLPLWLAADLALPIDLEGTYEAACAARRIDPT